MADQTPLSSDDLRAAFNGARISQIGRNRDNGTDEILKYLSATVRDLQDAGADIALFVRANASSNAYDLVYTTSGPSKGSAALGAHGLLRIGASTHLFAIATKFNDTNVKRLYVSKYNTTQEAGRIKIEKVDTRTQSVIFGNVYDFESDNEALKKVQNQLAELSGSTAALLESDSGNVFNREAPKMTKPALRTKP